MVVKTLRSESSGEIKKYLKGIAMIFAHYEFFEGTIETSELLYRPESR